VLTTPRSLAIPLALLVAACAADDPALPAGAIETLACADSPLPDGWFELIVEGGGTVDVDLGDRRALCAAPRCRYPRPAAPPVLTPRPDPARAFQGWRDCAGAGSRAACTLAADQTTATAGFARLDTALVHAVASAGFDAVGALAAGDDSLFAVIDSGPAPGARIAIARLAADGAPGWTTALPPSDGPVRLRLDPAGDPLVTVEPYWEGESPAQLHRLDAATGVLVSSTTIDYRTSHAVGLPGGDALVCNGEQFVWCRRFARDGSGPLANWALDDMATLRGLAVGADGQILMATEFHTDSRKGHSHLRAFTADGAPLWTVALNAREWRPGNDIHAVAASSDTIVVAGSEEGAAYLAAYAAADGAVRWRVPLPMNGAWPALGIEQLALDPVGGEVVAIAGLNGAVELGSDRLDPIAGESAAAVLRFDAATGAARSARRLGALYPQGIAVTPAGVVVGGSSWAAPVVLAGRELPNAGQADGFLIGIGRLP
jgi:outer membrane protein assembly factor BamB